MQTMTIIDDTNACATQHTKLYTEVGEKRIVALVRLSCEPAGLPTAHMSMLGRVSWQGDHKYLSTT